MINFLNDAFKIDSNLSFLDADVFKQEDLEHMSGHEAKLSCHCWSQTGHKITIKIEFNHAEKG